jgi:hypothetical protein
MGMTETTVTTNSANMSRTIEASSEDKERDFAREVLAHQLEGIMFHISLMKLYKAMGQRTLCKIHKAQVHEESMTHAKTAMQLMELFEEAIAPAKVETKEVPSEDEQDWKRTLFQTLSMWGEWEDETAKLYHEASEMIPQLSCWHNLAIAANKEAIRAREIMETVVKKM